VQASGAPGGARLIRGDAVGRYVILDHLASGGMGEVYRAYDPELDRAIAIKLVRPAGPHAVSATISRSRLLREAQALARVSHPNVIAVYDVGAVGDQVFIAMELVEGATLREWLRAGARGYLETLAALLGAARGLAAAHAVGVVHRDFKPDNVLVGDDGRVRVVDFGLAHAVEQEADSAEPDDEGSTGAALRRERESQQLTRTGEQLGTPLYMAPEQHRHRTVDARADQFAFCLTAYEALYGVRPFVGATRADLATAKIVGEIRPPPRETEVSTTVRDVILRGLAADPNERHASMRALIECLAPRRGSTRRRWLWAGGAAVAAAALAWGLAISTRTSQAMCKGAGQRASIAWDADRRATVEKAFHVSGRPYAADAFRRFAAAVDQRSADWVGMRTSVCEATRVRGEQSVHLMDLRMSCLDRRLAELAALTSALATQADGEAVDRSIEAVSSLPPLDRCANTAALLEAPQPPTDEQTRSAVEHIRAIADEALALERLGRFDEALALAKQGADAASAIEYAPVRAEALATRASLELQTGDAKAAEASYVEAARLSAEAGDRALGAEALVSLIWVVGHEQARLPEARAYATAAQVAVAGAGDDRLRSLYLSYYAVLEDDEGHYNEALAALDQATILARRLRGPSELRLARLYNEIGGVHRTAGHDDDAYAAYRQALQIRVRVQGAGHPDVGAALNNLSLMARLDGKLQEAVRYAEQALDTLEAALGPDHPNVSRALHSLALARAAQGKHEEALRSFRRALSIAVDRLGHQHPDVADLLNSTGFSLRALNRYDEAIADHERALSIYETALGPENPRVADTLVSLGLALVAADRLEDAKVRYDQALAIYEKALGSSHPSIAILLVNLGELAILRRAPNEALEHCRRALEIDRANLGEDHPDLSYSMLCIARALLAASDPGQTIPLLERTVELRERAGVDPLLVAEARFELARALWSSGRDRSRARRLASQAALTYANDAEKHAEISAWMKKRGLDSPPLRR